MIAHYRPRARLRKGLLAALLAAGLAAPGSAQLGSTALAQARPEPKLTDPRPCKDAPGFTCSTLTVPLDHSGKVAGELKLQVATAGNVNAPKGVLLFLAGGPGQPGVPFVAPTAQSLPEVTKNYRWVAIDQRGTGPGGIDCPELQKHVGSDIVAPAPAAVTECAQILGANRRFYRTNDTLADLELLRRALGVGKMSLDAISYGTFTAARYAQAHPTRVGRQVLDSVWPSVDPQRDEPLYLIPMQANRRVLRQACKTVPGCNWDPVKDLAALVRSRGDGVTLLDLLAVSGFLDPSYADVIAAMHKARQGDPADLDKMIADIRNRPPAKVEDISWGLYTATFCADSRFPWGDSAAPPRLRQAAFDARVKTLRQDQVWPYDRKTVAGMGFVHRCLPWPVTPPNPEPPTATLPPVPTLLINGDRDLSTPIEWAYEQATRTPRGKVVVVAGAGHWVQIQQGKPGEDARGAVSAFLNR